MTIGDDDDDIFKSGAGVKIIVTIVITLFITFQNPFAGLVFLIVFAIYQQVENNIISPSIQGNTLQLPSLIILISITIGTYVFGLLGAIISIPIAGMIKVLIEEYPRLKTLRG